MDWFTMKKIGKEDDGTAASRGRQLVVAMQVGRYELCEQ